MVETTPKSIDQLLAKFQTPGSSAPVPETMPVAAPQPVAVPRERVPVAPREPKPVSSSGKPSHPRELLQAYLQNPIAESPVVAEPTLERAPSPPEERLRAGHSAVDQRIKGVEQRRPGRMKRFRSALGRAGIAVLLGIIGLTAVGGVDAAANKGRVTETIVQTVNGIQGPDLTGDGRAPRSNETDNVMEFVAGDVLNAVQEYRQERAAADPAFVERVSETARESRTINFMIYGSDYDPVNRPGDIAPGNADAIKVVSIDPITGKAIITSLPRDLYSPTVLSEVNKFRVNGALWMGQDPHQRAEAMRGVGENATGLPVDFVMGFDAGNIENLIATFAPDGLEVFIPDDLHDNAYPAENYGSKEIFIQRGQQRLSPEQAAQYMRSRHGDNDFGRAERQTVIIEALVKHIAQSLLEYRGMDKISLAKAAVSGKPQEEVVQMLRTVGESLGSAQANGFITIDGPLNPSDMFSRTATFVEGIDWAKALSLGIQFQNDRGTIPDAQLITVEYPADQLVRGHLPSDPGVMIPPDVVQLIAPTGAFDSSVTTPLGNDMLYWQGLRAQVAAAVQQ